MFDMSGIYGLLNEDFFVCLKFYSIFINVGCGNVVDDEGFFSSFDKYYFVYVVLDVFI